ncbi:MAG TPA: rhomboid family intramembrane serine protease [Rugosimonospora sp.]|nr:rhomboid family intramembrane serine protease [Rugosimonospora sp.]
MCPRHPDRISYVRCQRCGRPVCPDCQRPAPVGVHCVDCVNAARRQVRPSSTVFGGRVRGQRPVVTMTIIALCVVSYVLQLTVPTWTLRWEFVPLLGVDEPWRFLTSAFLHSPVSFLHIVFNMIALWTVGPYLELTLGRERYTALYLVSAIGGSVGAVVLAPVVGGWATAMVGASGAVFGLFGAVLVVLRRLGRDAGGIIGVIVVNGVLSFVLPGIAWQAHLGGLVTGAVLGFAYASARAGRQKSVSVLATLVVLAALVASALVTYAQSGVI